MPIFSIGHGTRPIHELLALLKKYDIAWLADVRTIPYSKFNPQYNRESLHRSLKNDNIQYVYLGDSLGGRPPAPPDIFQKGIERLQQAYKQELKLTLLCSERSPEKCHRSKLIGQALQDIDISVQHIDEQGELKDQKTVMLLREQIITPPGLPTQITLL
ncbi:MAG TPA: DUF488 domain-containing protein [Puia sp.]|nr:DUF488 domain-containing protein [Puia sp.]